MLLTLEPQDVKNTGLKGTHNEKKTTFFMIVKVDESTIESAVQKFKDAKGVVAFNYTGDEAHLRTIADLGEKPVLIHKQVDKLDMNLDFLLGGIDPRVRIVLHVPNDYADMRSIHTYCAKYPNLHVEGGQFLRLNGCNIGAISETDLPKKTPNSKIKLFVDKDYSIQPIIDISEVNGELEFYEYRAPKDPNAPKTPRVRKPKVKLPEELEGKEKKSKAQAKPKTQPKPNKKKQLASLFGLNPEQQNNPFSNF